MDTKLTVVGNSQFAALRRTGDYQGGENGALSRIENDVFYAVFRQDVWDMLEESRARVDAEAPIGFRSNDT
jgi:hypothetical protein